MNIKQQIKENYEIAKSKGFYPDDSKIEDHLMGIVSELGEAYEAHRGGKFSEKGDIGTAVKYLDVNCPDIFNCFFVGNIKDSFEDELADVFIRLFNLCGWLDYNNIERVFNRKIQDEIFKISSISVAGGLIEINSHISTINQFNNNCPVTKIAEVMALALNFCIDNNIPIEKHIQAKKEYNRTREHLHGKKY